MLKQIAVSDVAIGIYMHEICGPWLIRPLWESRFLLDAESQMQRLRESAVTQVLIDTSKGSYIVKRAAALIKAELQQGVTCTTKRNRPAQIAGFTRQMRSQE